MLKSVAMYLLLLAGLVNSAQKVAINGVITNKNGNAVSGAIVSLKSHSLKDTTDGTGAYSLANGISLTHSSSKLSDIDAIMIDNHSIKIRLTKEAPVRVELFDCRGNLLEKFDNSSEFRSEYSMELKKQPFSVSMVLIRVSILQHSLTFRYLSLKNREYAICSFEGIGKLNTSGLVLYKRDAIVDTISVTAAGYKDKKVPITTYDGKVDITIDNEEVGNCTASKKANKTVSGTGTHKVVVETNSDPDIKEGTIYRPEDLGPGKNYPIFVWGNGGCSLNGSSNEAAMAEIASYGYFVIADGTPGGSGSRSMDMEKIKKPARAYVTWAIAENRKPCSAYYQSLDTTKVAANGFSCGGFFGQALAGDPRTTTWGVSSSGSFNDVPDLWNSVHTPVLIIEGNKDVKSSGGTDAYVNGLRDYNGIAPLKWPVYFISNKNFGHGGDLTSANGGHFTKINLAWLNWWLKGDTSATGKGVLVGSTCKYCTDSDWEIKSANIP